MKKKTIIIRITLCISFLIALFIAFQFTTYYELSSLNTTISKKDNKMIIKVDNNSEPRFVSYDLSEENGVYTIKVKVADYYGERWPQAIEIDDIDNIKAIKLSNDEETKLIYPSNN